MSLRLQRTMMMEAKDKRLMMEAKDKRLTSLTSLAAHPINCKRKRRRAGIGIGASGKKTGGMSTLRHTHTNTPAPAPPHFRIQVQGFWNQGLGIWKGQGLGRRGSRQLA